MTRLIWAAGVLILGISTGATGQARAADAVEIAIDSPEAVAQWTSPDDDAPALRRVVDKPTGQVVLEYAETSPLKTRSYFVDLDREQVEGTDTLQFEYKIVDAPARVLAAVHGYPDPGDQRRYYLHKRPHPHGQWQRVWLDLHHDDDGDWFSAKGVPEGKVRVEFQIRLFDMGETEAEPRVAVRFADVQLVRHPLKLTTDLHDVRMIRTREEVGSEYAMTLTNRLDQPQRARLLIDDAALDHFAVSLPAEAIELAPGEAKTIPVRITTSAETAATLPTLYAERAPIFAVTTDAPGEVTPWHRGYLLYSLTAAVPPDVDREGAPWLHAEAQRQRALSRAEQRDRAARQIAKIVKQAESLLDISPIPPGEPSLHGNPNQMVHKGFKSQMRFRGPGKIWVDSEKRLLTEAERAELSPAQHRAIGYSHHRFLSSAAHTLALAWWLTGRAEFAERARDILLAYAERYPHWPRTQPSSLAFGAKVGMGTLQESWWFRPLPLAFDLVRGSGVLSAAQDRQIVEGLMVPVAVTIRQHRIEANQQAESNAAMGLGALLAERWDLVADTIDSGGGLRAQWRNDFDADGYSSERDMAYHFAALAPFVELAAAYEQVGIDLFDRDFKRLFDAPIAYAPDQLPGGPAGLYLHAYEHYRDPSYLPQVRRAFERWPLEALITPIDPAKVMGGESDTKLGHSVLEASGYTILRRGTGAADLTAIAMNWGSPSKRNGHAIFDTQAIWRGQPLNRQTDRIGYGYSQSRFCYEPIASNTVVVDGERHSMLRADQVAMLTGDHPAARWLSPRKRPLYAGVRWARTAAILGETVVVIDQLDSDTPRRFDWVTYPAGVDHTATIDGGAVTWTEHPALNEQGKGYGLLENPRRAEADAPTPATVRYRLGEEAGGQLTLLGSADHLLTATGWAGWHPKAVPLYIQRATDATEAWFVGAYTGAADADAAPAEVRRIEVRGEGRPVPPHEAIAVEVVNQAGRFFMLTASTDRTYDVAGQTMRGPLTVMSLESP